MRKKRDVFYEKKDVGIETLFAFLKLDSDHMLRNYAMDKLRSMFGDGVLEIIAKAVKAETEEDCFKELKALDSIDDKSFILEHDNFYEAIEKVRTSKKLSISSIMEMYHSEDDFLIAKSKEYIVINYEYFVHDIIHKYYSTVSSEYEKELFQCGTMGLVKAMENYDVKHAAFTTYCIFFVKHEITEQINFYRNGSTVYYNNVQKKIKEAIERLKRDGFEVKVSNIAILTDFKPEIIKRELDYMDAIKFVYLDSDDTKDRACEYESTPEAIFEKKEKYESLYRSLDSLPEHLKRVVLMKYDSDRTNVDIAAALGITIGQVKAYYQKGLRLLKKDLENRDSYHEYISSAEKEMYRYKVNPVASKKIVEQQFDALCELTGDIAQLSSAPAPESSEQSGLASLISSFGQ